MYFRNRNEAAELLARKLLPYRKSDPLILGIPRGSVPMAKVLADRLDGELDVALVHKIGAPGNPEFAIGSVSEFGTIYPSEAVERYGISREYVERIGSDEIDRLKARRNTYSPRRPPIDPEGRTVIIVDDGIATGSTMLAAARAVRSQKPKKVIVASPVASGEAMSMLSREADELVVLDVPVDFYAISQFYEDFPQVSDEEVLEILSVSRKPPRGRAA